jgi:hypothetical protein
LLKASLVAKHVKLFILYIEPERDLFVLRRWLERLDAAGNDGRKLHPSLLQLKLSRQDARHVEEVVDRLRLTPMFRSIVSTARRTRLVS